MRAHIPSDIPAHNGFIEARNLQIQKNIEDIEEWTKNKQMKLNGRKSCGMIFNFTQKYQFTSRITMQGQPLEIVDHTKLLGVILTNDLRWSRNTDYIIKRANARMEILRRLSGFNAPVKDMIQTYISYIRSILEQSCVIWHSSLTQEDSEALERVQRNAFRNILKEKYESYENALLLLKMDTLFERREKLLFSFGRKCEKLEQTKDLFPRKVNEHQMNHRFEEKYHVLKANTERMRNSTVPYIQRLLNTKEQERKKAAPSL